MRFEGIASTTAPDREGEQMTRRALESMARAGSVELRAGHRRGERLGAVEQLHREGDRLRVQGRLDESNPRARALWERLREGARMALSVGGRKRVVRRYSPVAGRYVRMIEDARLDHVAVCRPEEARNPEAEIVASGEGSLTPRPPLPAGEGEIGRETWPPLPLSAQIRVVRGRVAELEARGEVGSHVAAEGHEASVSPPPFRECGQGGRPGGGAPIPPACTPGRRQSLPVVKRTRKRAGPQLARTGEMPAPPRNDELWKGVL